LEKETHQQVNSRPATVQSVNGTRPVFAATNDPFALQRAVGNQGMRRLLESGRLQAKLHVSQPGDADEREADRPAEQIVSAQPAPRLQRKCACGGSCGQCQEEQESIIHRRARTAPGLRSVPFSIQRQTATSTTDERSHRAAAADADTRRDQAQHPGGHPRTLIVEDDAPSLVPGQMRKREFVALLQSTTCATADAVLASVGHGTKGCPYIKKWLAHYKEQDAAHLTRAMRKYAPETGRARSAHEAIALVNQRVERAALTWAKTGKVTDLPDGIQEEMGGGGGFLGAVMGFAHSGFGSALLGFIGGGKKAEKEGAAGGAAGVQRKSRDGAAAGGHDAAAVQEQLGSGQALDGGVQSRMSAAFGYDFSGVRVHADAKAGELSDQLNARAFTIGRDVAFAQGEYQPGTLIGDALIAHELAHVVQQGGGQASGGTQTKDASLGDDRRLEQDADRSAVGAVVSAWSGSKKGLADVSANSLPRLKSGLKLQRCANCGKQTASPANASHCTTPSPEEWKAAVTSARAITENDKKRDALSNLVQQAVCPLGLTVQNAGSKHSTEIDPEDYAPFPVVNFDIDLNRKQSWPRGGNACKKEPVPSHIKPGDCDTKPLQENAGYNFRVGKTLYVVVGPTGLAPETPAVTRRLAEHEQYLVTTHTVKVASGFKNDPELDAWTHDFVNYFHLLGFKEGTRYSGNGWEPLLDRYYEGSETSNDARKSTVERLSSYYKKPPATAAAAGRPGHPTNAKDVQELFMLWMAKMENQRPSRQLIQDLRTKLSTP